MAKRVEEVGVVKRIVRDKGFGFIAPNRGGPEFFFHRSDCADFESLGDGTPVTFVPGDGPKGPRASQVQITS